MRCAYKWYNETLCAVNDAVVRVGVIEGEYHWHQHEAEDEFFYVVEGRLAIDLEDRTVELAPAAGIHGSQEDPASHARPQAYGNYHGRESERRSYWRLTYWRLTRRGRTGIRLRI